jgi:hypothetical protein
VTRASSYDPDSSLARGGDERLDDRYYAVGHTGYEPMRFAPDTSVGEAKQSVLASNDAPFPQAKVGKSRQRRTSHAPILARRHSKR